MREWVLKKWWMFRHAEQFIASQHREAVIALLTYADGDMWTRDTEGNLPICALGPIVARNAIKRLANNARELRR